MIAKETMKSFRKKSSFIVMIFLLVIVFLFTSSFKSDIEINGQVMNESGAIPNDSLLASNKLNEENNALTINGLKIFVSDMVVNNNIAYISTPNVGVEIYNLSKPQYPKHIGRLGHFGAQLFFSENMLYVMDSGYVNIFNVSNPYAPVNVGNIKLLDWGSGAEILVSNNYGFITYQGTNTILIAMYDFSNLTNPTLIGNYSEICDFNVNDIAISGDLVYLSLSNFGIKVLNTSNPANITLVKNFEDINPNEMVISNDLLYVADGTQGLIIYDISNPNITNEIGLFMQSTLRIAINNDYAFVITADDIFRIIDIEDSTNLVQISENMKIDNVDVMVASDEYVYLGNSDCLTIIDIKNPLKPMILINEPWTIITYFIIAVILIIVPIFCLVYYVIYPRYTKKKAMKEIEDTIQLDDPEKKSGPMTDLLRIYDKRIVYNIISLGLISFFVQNAFALLIIPTIGIVETQTSTIGGWMYYLWNIPLILDLIVGLIFTIGFLVAYCSTKNRKAMLTSIFWTLWMIFAIGYRVLLGMPSYKYVYCELSFTNVFNRMYLASILFAVSQVLFWFAIFMTDLSLRIPNESIFGIIWFGSVNFLVGIPSAFLIAFMGSSGNVDVGLAAFVVFGIAVPTFLAKTILPPVVGMVSIFTLYREVKKDYTTNCI